MWWNNNPVEDQEDDFDKEGHFQRVAVVLEERLRQSYEENRVLREELETIKRADRELLEKICLSENRSLKKQVQELQEKIKILENINTETKKYYDSL